MSISWYSGRAGSELHIVQINRVVSLPQRVSLPGLGLVLVCLRECGRFYEHEVKQRDNRNHGLDVIRYSIGRLSVHTGNRLSESTQHERLHQSEQ
jgi:hypothetical protein